METFECNGKIHMVIENNIWRSVGQCLIMLACYCGNNLTMGIKIICNKWSISISYLAHYYLSKQFTGSTVSSAGCYSKTVTIATCKICTNFTL